MASRKLVQSAFETCLKAVNPRSAVRDAISITPSHLQIVDSTVPPTSKIIVISFGKASIQMAHGVEDVLTSSKIQKTFILAPDSQKDSDDVTSSEIWYGAKNNLPDENSVKGTRHLIQEIQKWDSESTVFIFLISGGGSALLTSPKHPVTLKEKLEVIRMMQANGATIQELNTVRQKISEVKGGKLLRKITVSNYKDYKLQYLFRKGQSISLIISDVIGNPIDLIASGPTVIPNGQNQNISEILKNLKIQETDLPDSVQKAIQELEAPPPSTTSQNYIISSNSFALRAASESLTSSGFNTRIVTSSLSGNAAEIGRKFASLISSKSIENHELLEGKGAGLQYPMAFVFGGETTVTLAENPGKGGRNQEMVLACLDSLGIQNPPRHQFIFLSAGTDGQDGPTDAAGAIISSEDLLNPMTSSTSEYLKKSDSWTFWSRFNNGESHLKTGPSGTNVMDIQILVLDKK